MTTIQRIIKEQMGFITSKEEQDAVLKENRLQMVLVRCGSGRFLCPIQDLDHFVDIINKDGRDYVRDVSLKN